MNDLEMHGTGVMGSREVRKRNHGCLSSLSQASYLGIQQDADANHPFKPNKI